MKKKQKKRRKGWKYYWQRNRFYMITLLAFLILSFASLHILQNSLLENAQRTGASLARSFSVEEERSLSSYEALIRMGAGSLDRMVQETSNTEEFLTPFSMVRLPEKENGHRDRITIMRPQNGISVP